MEKSSNGSSCNNKNNNSLQLEALPEQKARDRMEGQDVEWESLPRDICEKIGKQLESRLEVDRFRSVCKKWRSSLPPPNRFPLHVPPPPTADDYNKKFPYFITQNTWYHLVDDSQTSELVLFEELNQGGRFEAFAFRFNSSDHGIQGERRVFSKTPYEYSSVKKQRHVTRLLSNIVNKDNNVFTLSYVSQTYCLRQASEKSIGTGMWGLYCTFSVAKIVLLSKDMSISPCYAPDDDLAVVALLDNGKLALLRLALKPLHWQIISMPSFKDKYVMDDIVAYQGKLCAVDSKGSAFVFSNDDVFSPSSSVHLLMTTKIASANILRTPTKVTQNAYFCERDDVRNRLVVSSSGELFLLFPVDERLSYSGQPKIKVYKLTSGVWLEAESFGDEVLIVAPEYSFSVSTRDHAMECDIPLANRILYNFYPFLKRDSMSTPFGRENTSEDVGKEQPWYSPHQFRMPHLFPSTSSSLLSTSTSTSAAAVLVGRSDPCLYSVPENMALLY